MGDLASSRPDDVTILDMEASIEHLTRGTVREVDALLVVTEPYYRSLETAARLVPLAHELGVERVWLVGNKVRSDNDQAAIVEFCDRRGYELIGTTPFDDGVSEADRLGRGLIDVSPTGPAVIAIAALADTLTERLVAPNLSAG